MKISMEVPLKHLEEISEMTDFDFALTHLILEYGSKGVYTKFYKSQAKKGRVVWLDNSIHELLEAESLARILQAADMINATHIVAPEVLHNPVKTYEHIIKTKEEIYKNNHPFKLVGSWNGYHKDYLTLTQTCDVVALPFDRPRQILSNEEVSKTHYFGFRSFDELRRKPPESIDTSMPIRAGVQHIDLNERERRPNLGYLDYDIEITKEQMRLVKANISAMKRAGNERR